MDESVNVVCLLISEGFSDTFDTQVLTPLSKHAAGVQPRVVVCDANASAVRMKKRHGVPISTISAVSSRAGWRWKDLLLFKRWLRSHYSSSSDAFIVHAKGSRPTLLALEMRRWFAHVSVVFDYCGAEPAEYRETLESKGELSDIDRRRLKQVELVEERAATQADHILCVSQALADYLAERYPDQLPDMTVVPRCADAAAFAAAVRHRDATRRELGLAERLVVTYKGSLDQHQCVDESLRIFKAIKATRPDAHFLGLTGSTERLRFLCVHAGIHREDYTVLPIETETVPRLLGMSDVGLLPRRQTVANRVASPVKFAEYLASGTPVILSEHLGDYSTLVRRQHVGVVLPPARNGGGILDLSPLNAFLAEYSSDVTGWRRRCRHTARRYFDWSVHLSSVNTIYHDASRGSHIPA